MSLAGSTHIHKGWSTRPGRGMTHSRLYSFVETQLNNRQTFKLQLIDGVCVCVSGFKPLIWRPPPFSAQPTNWSTVWCFCVCRPFGTVGPKLTLSGASPVFFVLDTIGVVCKQQCVFHWDVNSHHHHHHHSFISLMIALLFALHWLFAIDCQLPTINRPSLCLSLAC